MISFLKASALLALAAATPASSQYVYNYHMFHDFRNHDAPTTEPARVNTDAENAAATVQQGYLTDPAFTSDWRIQTWGSPVGPNAPYRKQYSNGNVYLQRDAASGLSHLILRATRSDSFVSSGEIDTTLNNILHASINVRARIVGDPGACAGIFTYFNGENESDIEVLTHDPTNIIRYTNQPGLDENGNEIPGASTRATMLNGARWNEWHTHRLDWTPDLSSWYLDGQLAHTKTYGIPREPSTIILNMWGDGGPLWTGEMAIGAAAYLEIEYIEIYYNLA
ncbi:concanavalin A-like lectin/glucanase domain-containing protein [Aspergillus karnatakaensis]|uniref:glycoside hydrolase family 16 protein n=1 Tax=Aspergillus karnatakaensis TaxID=1810916 RepID=UPI003CCCA72D